MLSAERNRFRATDDIVRQNNTCVFARKAQGNERSTFRVRMDSHRRGLNANVTFRVEHSRSDSGPARSMRRRRKRERGEVRKERKRKRADRRDVSRADWRKSGSSSSNLDLECRAGASLFFYAFGTGWTDC